MQPADDLAKVRHAGVSPEFCPLPRLLPCPLIRRAKPDLTIIDGRLNFTS